MISPARTLAYKLLCQIEAQRLFSDDALNSREIERLEPRDRHLTTEIVYGTLRWQGLLDHILAASSSRPWQDVAPGARILLRMGLYQMWMMDRIPDHALVHDAVELAKRELGKGIDRYLNGMLRHIARTRPWQKEGFSDSAPHWIRGSLPQWLWERWASRYGELHALEYALSLNRPPRPAFRLGKNTPESFPFEAVRSDVVPGAAIRVSGLSGQDSTFRYQDEASQLIPYLLGCESGWNVWDACAAPGGKTAILGYICGESGRVVASDLRKDRVYRLKSFLKSEGNHADVLVADATNPAPLSCCFDAVLADVPCSGLGTLRRNPEIKWQFKRESFAVLQQTQKKILEAVSCSVRVGGRLLYSTCSTEPEENEAIVEAFLSGHPEFILQRPDSPNGVEQWVCEDGMVRTFPGTRIWDGFFAALMVRR